MKLVTLYLYCDCETENHEAGIIINWTEMQIIKEDWHGEQKRFECPKCGRQIKMEASLVSGEIEI